MTRTYDAINWNEKQERTLIFWEQNLKQMWTDTELSPLKDSKVWKALSDEERETYKKVLGGLTLLDTIQSTVGMPKIAENVTDLQEKAVFSFMAMMEAIHAKSYSTIFTTLLVKEEIDEIFQWVKENKYLQTKAQIIDSCYQNINTPKDLYMAMVASVFLESFLFYSGFFYPLFLSGQGKMIHSGEIINLIIRDEQIHGSWTGINAQDIYATLSVAEQKQVDEETLRLLHRLMSNELLYTEEIYGNIFLDTEVKRFLRYNANKALANLGKDAVYEDEEINAIVLNGLNTETKTHDFFSVKGNGYQKGKVEPLRDEDFIFDTKDEFIQR